MNIDFLKTVLKKHFSASLSDDGDTYFRGRILADQKKEYQAGEMSGMTGLIISVHNYSLDRMDFWDEIDEANEKVQPYLIIESDTYIYAKADESLFTEETEDFYIKIVQGLLDAANHPSAYIT